ncbi:MAG: hypothetical protein ACREJC_12645 [Tepidisphaeraceae bacterium]
MPEPAEAEPALGQALARGSLSAALQWRRQEPERKPLFRSSLASR